MKRTIILLTTLAMTFGIGGCTEVKKNNYGKINIVCSLFPQYDWTRQLIKGAEDKFNLTYVADNGSDIHSYQATAENIVEISESDLVILTGGASDGWIKDTAQKTDTKIINMLDIIGDDRIAEHSHNSEPDEHLWLSLENAEEVCIAIGKALGELDAENKNLYERNTTEYTRKLDMLDEKFENAVENSRNQTVIFADRFPFRYLTEEYDIEYYAAFPGCSAETEASFETVAFLSQKLEEKGLSAVIVTEGSDRKIAETIIENTASKNQEIAVMNSMQAVSQEQVQEGAEYIKIMEENLEALKIALN